MLVDPVIGSKPTISMDNVLVHGISITVAFIIAALISGLFAELHHYHNDDCGGIVSVASTVSGNVLSYLTLSASMVAVIFQISDSVIQLADLIDRQSGLAFTDETHHWSVKIGMLTLLILLVIFLSTLFGILIISRVAVILAFSCFAFSYVFAGYGIHHKHFHEHLHLSSNGLSPWEETQLQSYMAKGVNDMDDDGYIDSGLHSYITYLIKTVGQMLIINLLLPLTEDNKIKKHRINVIGAAVFAAVSATSLFMNLTLAHITSDLDVFVDQAGLTMGMPKELVLTISVTVGLAIVARAILVLYSVARVACYVVVRREETGNTFRPCKILKVPMFVNGIQCAVVTGTLFIEKEDVTQFALVSLFIYVFFGAICHILHRFSSLKSSEPTPVVESNGIFGSLQPFKAIKILVVTVVISSLALCISDIVSDYIPMPTYYSKQIYAIVRIFLALTFIGTVSVMASFEQRHGIAGLYKWLLWTPLVPCSAILLSCVTIVYNWFWGAIMSAVVLLLAANLFIIDKLTGTICCTTEPQTADDVSQR
ncbi:hypothetical protein ACHWQZ_G000567 [Mnemiopsis leidyi]